MSTSSTLDSEASVSATSVPEKKKVDGRTLRPGRTKRKLEEATASLIREGNYQPRTAVIADRADVSVRSIFQHYTDTEGLFIAVAEREMKTILGKWPTVSANEDPGRRLSTLVAACVSIWESDIAILEWLEEHCLLCMELKTIRDRLEIQFGGSVRSILDPELVVITDLKLRTELADAIVVNLHWRTWRTLRDVGLRDSSDIREILRKMVMGSVLFFQDVFFEERK